MSRTYDVKHKERNVNDQISERHYYTVNEYNNTHKSNNFVTFLPLLYTKETKHTYYTKLYAFSTNLTITNLCYVKTKHNSTIVNTAIDICYLFGLSIFEFEQQ